MKKIGLLLASLAMVVALTGCGGEKKEAAKPGSGAAKKVVLKIGASPVPHAEILSFIKPMLAKENIDMQIIEFNDYVKPNMALNDKELDANFFQHKPYMDKFAGDRKMALVSLVAVHLEPMGIYSRTVKDIKNLPAGSKVSIPNDPTNGGRALAVLEKAGLIKLRSGVGINGTAADIQGNPKGLMIMEIEAALLPRSLEDVAISVINSNFAMQANLNPVKDALFVESKDSPYANIVTVRKGDETRKEMQALKKVITSPEVKKFIEEKYKGAIVPSF